MLQSHEDELRWSRFQLERLLGTLSYLYKEKRMDLELARITPGYPPKKGVELLMEAHYYRGAHDAIAGILSDDAESILGVNVTQTVVEDFESEDQSKEYSVSYHN